MTKIKILVGGKIPANTVCPYIEKCDPQKKSCNHTGIDHYVPFSCGFVRAFELFGDRK